MTEIEQKKYEAALKLMESFEKDEVVMKEKRNWKQELKDFWEEYGSRIKTGAKCLGLGLLIGFIRGACTVAKMNAENDARFIDMLSDKDDEDSEVEDVEEEDDDEGDREIDEFFEVLKKNGWEVKKF